MSSRLVTVMAALVLPALGCSVPFHATAPAGFVVLQDQERHGYDFRATDPDGLVLAVRSIDNDPRGDQQFWSQAIANRLRDMGGYHLLERRDVKAKSGHAGVQFRFGHDEGRTPHLYTLTLFVTPERLFVLEAGGEKKLFESNAGKVDAFVNDFVPR